MSVYAIWIKNDNDLLNFEDIIFQMGIVLHTKWDNPIFEFPINKSDEFLVIMELQNHLEWDENHTKWSSSKKTLLELMPCVNVRHYTEHVVICDLVKRDQLVELLADNKIDHEISEMP